MRNQEQRGGYSNCGVQDQRTTRERTVDVDKSRGWCDGCDEEHKDKHESRMQTKMDIVNERDLTDG